MGREESEIMNMKRRFCLLLFSLALIFLSGSLTQVFACSCLQPQPVCEAFGSAKAVFVGEVIEGKSAERMSDMIGAKTRDNSFVFKVSQNFFGAEEDKNITILTGFGFGDCGYPFQKGEKYLVYAYEHEGKLYTSICSRTRPAASVEDDFEELKYLLLTSGAKIDGTVTQYAKSSLEKDSKQPMTNLKIRLEQLDGQKKIFDAVTDDKGNYSIRNLSAGKYKITPLLPEGWEVDYPDNDFPLNDKGCAKKDIFVKNDSLVFVKVIDSDGNPVKNIWVEFVPAGIEPKPDTLRFADEFSVTNPQGGLYKFGLPPGRYTVSVNKYMLPDAENPYPATFYPNTGDRAKAKVIEIKPGTKIEDIVIQLPPPLSMKEIRGRVFWKDNKPAENVYVNLRDAESKQNISDARTDKVGNFVMKGFTGRKYIIETFIDETVDGKPVEFESKDIEFILDEKTGEFKLILARKVEEN